MAKIKGSRIEQNVKRLMNNKKQLRFDLEIQRNEVWKEDRKSLFIHSLIQGYPVPSIYALDEGDDNIWVLDGKQRLTTAIGFMNEVFTLDENTPPIEVEKEDGSTSEIVIAGKGFSQLPKEFQEEIESYNITIYQFKNLTDEQKDEFFYRLNSGVALNQIELTRVVAGSEVMKAIHEITQSRFFGTAINLTNDARNRFVDEELVLQIMSLVNNDCKAVGLSGKEIREFARELNSNGVSEDLQNKMVKTTEYLSAAFPVNDKSLKKVHIPMIFVTAMQAIEDKVEPRKFSGWVQWFLNPKNTRQAYANNLTGGTAKKDKVAKRLTVMLEAYQAGIENAKEYVVPAEKPTNGTRGRRPKVTATAELEKSKSEVAGTEEKIESIDPQNDANAPVQQESEQLVG